MTIKTIVIEGAGQDITISRTTRGAEASIEQFTRRGGANALCIAHFDRGESPEARYPKALEVAKAVFGTGPRGRVAATNSMVHELLNEIERVAG